MVAILADLPEVAALRLRQRSHDPVIDHEHVEAAEPSQQIAPAAVGTCPRCRYSCTVPRPIEQLRAICRSPRPTSNFNRRTSLILRTDKLLVGKLILPFGRGCLPLCCPAPLPCGNYSGEADHHSGTGLKLFGFIPESVFTFVPERCSDSPRNTVRNHPGIAFTFGIPESIAIEPK